MSFIKDVVELPDNKQGILRVYLRYLKGDRPVLKGIQRVSRPGLRRYFDATEVVASTFNNRGIMVISTSSGVMTNFEASKKVAMKCVHARILHNELARLTGPPERQRTAMIERYTGNHHLVELDLLTCCTVRSTLSYSHLAKLHTQRCICQPSIVIQ